MRYGLMYEHNGMTLPDYGYDLPDSALLAAQRNANQYRATVLVWDRVQRREVGRATPTAGSEETGYGLPSRRRAPRKNPPPRFRPGQRIVTTDYGQERHGTVTRVGRSLVFVKLDGVGIAGRERWMHPESLRPASRRATRNDGYGYGFDDDNGNPPLSASMRRRYNFFRKHGGGIVGESARTALALAHAEDDADSRGWVVYWEPELDVDDSWMTPEERKQPHGVYVAVLRDEKGKVLAYLGNIFDPDSNYMRVVSAELAAEALGR